MSDEQIHRGGAGFADAVTVSFADAERGWFGMARLGLADQGSALAILFHGPEPAGALAQGSLPRPDATDWSAVSVGALRHGVEAGFERWTLAWDGAECGFDLVLEAASAPAEWAELGGMDGYEQLVTVRGTARAGDVTEEIEGLGQRGHSWGEASWKGVSLVRNLSAWLGAEKGGIFLSAVRPEKAKGHDAEQVWAAVIERGDPLAVADPRLSTTYDGDGHQRRAGLELWLSDEEEHYPVRAAGEVLCGSSLDLGALTLDLAFMRWHAEGAEGVGRYDVLRKN